MADEIIGYRVRVDDSALTGLQQRLTRVLSGSGSNVSVPGLDRLRQDAERATEPLRRPLNIDTSRAQQGFTAMNRQATNLLSTLRQVNAEMQRTSAPSGLRQVEILRGANVPRNERIEGMAAGFANSAGFKDINRQTLSNLTELSTAIGRAGRAIDANVRNTLGTTASSLQARSVRAGVRESRDRELVENLQRRYGGLGDSAVTRFRSDRAAGYVDALGAPSNRADARREREAQQAVRDRFAAVDREAAAVRSIRDRGAASRTTRDRDAVQAAQAEQRQRDQSARAAQNRLAAVDREERAVQALRDRASANRVARAERDEARRRESLSPAARGLEDLRRGFRGNEETPRLQQIGHVARISTMYGALYTVLNAFMNGVQQTVQGFLELDSAVHDLAVATGAGTEELRSVVQEAVQIGSAVGIADAESARMLRRGAGALGEVDQLGTSGISATNRQLMESAGRMSFIAGRAGDTESVQKSLIGLGRAFDGLDPSGITDLENMVTYLSRQTSQDPTEILRSATSIGGTAAASGLSQAQLAAVLSQVSSSTGKSMDDMTAGLRNVLEKMSSPSMRDALRGAGVNTVGTTAMEQLQQLGERGLSDTELQRIAVRTGRGSTSEVFTAMVREIPRINQLATAAESADGSGEDAFESALKTITGLLRDSGKELVNLGNNLANLGFLSPLAALLKLFNEMLKAANALVSSFNELPATFRNVVGGAVTMTASLALLSRAFAGAGTFGALGAMRGALLGAALGGTGTAAAQRNAGAAWMSGLSNRPNYAQGFSNARSRLNAAPGALMAMMPLMGRDSDSRMQRNIASRGLNSAMQARMNRDLTNQTQRMSRAASSLVGGFNRMSGAAASAAAGLFSLKGMLVLGAAALAVHLAVSARKAAESLDAVVEASGKYTQETGEEGVKEQSSRAQAMVKEALAQQEVTWNPATWLNVLNRIPGDSKAGSEAVKWLDIFDLQGGLRNIGQAWRGEELTGTFSSRQSRGQAIEARGRQTLARTDRVAAEQEALRDRDKLFDPTSLVSFNSAEGIPEMLKELGAAGLDTGGKLQAVSDKFKELTTRAQDADAAMVFDESDRQSVIKDSANAAADALAVQANQDFDSDLSRLLSEQGANAEENIYRSLAKRISDNFDGLGQVDPSTGLTRLSQDDFKQFTDRTKEDVTAELRGRGMTPETLGEDAYQQLFTMMVSGAQKEARQYSPGSLTASQLANVTETLSALSAEAQRNATIDSGGSQLQGARAALQVFESEQEQMASAVAAISQGYAAALEAYEADPSLENETALLTAEQSMKAAQNEQKEFGRKMAEVEQQYAQLMRTRIAQLGQLDQSRMNPAAIGQRQNRQMQTLRRQMDFARTEEDRDSIQTEINDLQWEMAEYALSQAAAFRIAGVNPGNAIGRAQAELQNARDRLASLPTDSQAYAETLDQVNQLQNDLVDMTMAITHASRMLRVDPRDTFGRIAVETQNARDRLRLAQARGDQQGAVDAQQQLQDLAFQRQQEQTATRVARIGARVTPGDAVGQARAGLEQARVQLAAQLRGTKEWFDAQAALNQAQYDYNQALLTYANNQRLLGIDLTDPVARALAGVKDATARLNASRSASERAANEITLRESQAGLDSARFSQRLGDIQHAHRMGRMSEHAYLAYLDSERARLNNIANKSRQQIEQLQQIDELIKTASDSMSGQFNMGDIDLPTVYEVRRSMQSQFAGMSAGASVASVTQNHITINGADAAGVLQYLEGQMGGAGIASVTYG